MGGPDDIGPDGASPDFGGSGFTVDRDGVQLPEQDENAAAGALGLAMTRGLDGEGKSLFVRELDCGLHVWGRLSFDDELGLMGDGEIPSRAACLEGVGAGCGNGSLKTIDKHRILRRGGR